MKTHITTVEKERNLGVFTHLGTFLGFLFPLATFLVPLIIWLSNKDSKFVSDHSKSALNFQISMLLYHVILLIAGIIYLINDIPYIDEFIEQISDNGFDLEFIVFLIVLFGIIFILATLSIVFTITAAIKASKGNSYVYPMSIKFIS